MKIYDRLVMAPLTDVVCSLPAADRARRLVTPFAEGVVLEPGIGSGLNLAHYDRGAVRRIIGLDPRKDLLRLARRRAAGAELDVEFIAAPAEEVPLEDRSVDTVLLTYTACSIAGIGQALKEFRRVLKPSGRLLFCEHGRAPEPRTARFQDALNPLWRRLAGGCNLNREIAPLLEEAGFSIERVESFYAMPRPKFLAYHYVGAARRR